MTLQEWDDVFTKVAQSAIRHALSHNVSQDDTYKYANDYVYEAIGLDYLSAMRWASETSFKPEKDECYLVSFAKTAQKFLDKEWELFQEQQDE